MEKKRILFMLNSLTAGGAEKQTLSLISAMNKDVFDVSLVYLDPVDNLRPQIEDERLSLLLCLDRKKRFDWRVIRKIIRLVRAHHFHTVVCVGPYPLVYAFGGRLLSFCRYTIVQVFHMTTPAPGLWTAIKNRLVFKRLMNRCDKIVFVCKRQMTYWIDHFAIRPDRSTYIYNGIDVDLFTDQHPEKETDNTRAGFGFGPDDFVVGLCAALRPEKKHTDFVDAVRMARKSIPHIKGLLIGDGALKGEIQDYIEANNLSSTIKMSGFVNDVRPFIRICNCMVLTSHAVETFSMSALESMAMGKPVVLTDLGGAGELVEHGISGFIYERGDIAGLVGHLAALNNNNHYIAMGAKARQRVRSLFTRSRMVDEYEQLFLSI